MNSAVTIELADGVEVVSSIRKGSVEQLGIAAGETSLSCYQGERCNDRRRVN